VRPELVCEVRHDKLERNRFPPRTRFLRFRPDKDPEGPHVARGQASAPPRRPDGRIAARRLISPLCSRGTTALGWLRCKKRFLAEDARSGRRRRGAGSETRGGLVPRRPRFGGRRPSCTARRDSSTSANDCAVSVARRSFSLASRHVSPSPRGHRMIRRSCRRSTRSTTLVNGRRKAEALRRSESLRVVTTSALRLPGRLLRPELRAGSERVTRSEAEARERQRPSRRAAQRVNAPIFRRLEREWVLQGATVHPRNVTSLATPCPRRPTFDRLDPPASDCDRPEQSPEPGRDRRVERLEEPVIVFVGAAPIRGRTSGCRAGAGIWSSCLAPAPLRSAGSPREVLGSLNAARRCLARWTR
jgi:hypothetical protein